MLVSASNESTVEAQASAVLLFINKLYYLDQKRAIMKTQFVIPDFQNISLALVVALGSSLSGASNLVIFFTESSQVDWDLVRSLVGEPSKPIMSIRLSSSPWSYRCCDYTVGVLLGFVEVLTSKSFKKMPNPVESGISLQYYELS